jgi:hypothetical protein
MTSPSDPVDIADITHMLNDEPVEKPAPRPRGDKTSEAELEQRIRMVVKWITLGMPYSEVVAGCCGSFGVSERTAQSYASEANQRIKDANVKDRDLEIAKAKARYESHMQLATQDKQYAAAINANTQLVKLLGLAEPDKIEHGASDTLTQLVSQIRGGDPKEPV